VRLTKVFHSGSGISLVRRSNQSTNAKEKTEASRAICGSYGREYQTRIANGELKLARSTSDSGGFR